MLDSSNPVLPLNIQDNLPTKKSDQSHSSSCLDGMGLISSHSGQEGVLEQKKKKKNFFFGVLLMFLTVTLLTIGHSICKTLAFTSPYISQYDIILFMGIYMVPFNIAFAVKSRSLKQLYSFTGETKILLLLRACCGVINALCICYAINQLPLSKAIFMLSLTPVSCAIVAFVFLREKLTTANILCLFGAAAGIYILTLSKEDNGKSANISGFLACLGSITLGGSGFVITKFLNLHKVHASIVGLALGIAYLQPLTASFFIEGTLHYQQYTLFDITMLLTHGLLAATWILCMFIAGKYLNASFIAPIINLENVFTVCIDIFFFQYHFTKTDVLGMAVIGVCILTPIMSNIVTK